MGKTVQIRYKRTGTTTYYFVTLTFPLVSEISENSPLNEVTFYAIPSTNTTANPTRLGTLQEINALEEGKYLATITGEKTTNNGSPISILYKFNNETKNSSSYDESIKVTYTNTNGTLAEFTSRFFTSDVCSVYGYTNCLNYFVICNTATAKAPSSFSTSITDYTFIGNSVEPEPPKPSTKKINITFSDNVYSNAIQSDIEMYYRINGTTDIIKICDVLTSSVKSFDIEYSNTYLGINILYKYKNDNLNNSTYNESLQIDNNYSYFDSNIGYFVFSSNNVAISYNSNITVKEIKYNYIKLQLPSGEYTSNITHLDVSQYPQDIILTCNSNYYFSSAPIITIFYMGQTTQLDFTLNDNSTVATLKYNSDYVNSAIYSYSVNIEPITTITEKYGLISLYKPTGDILKNLSSKLLYKYTLKDVEQVLDLSKYIVSFLSIPVDVETTGNKELKLCNISTGIELPYIDDNIINLDFGDITIDGIYHNSLDFKNTTIEMILPYIDTVELKPGKYMNKTINLTYRIDLFTGDTLAILKVNNIIYDTFSGKCAIEIPFISQAENKEKNVLKYVNSNLLNENIPMIIIRTNDINNKLLYSTNEYKEKLNTLLGFNSLDNIELNISSDMLQNDIDSIKNLLSNGVIF